MMSFLLLQVITPHYHKDDAVRNMHELEQLVETYGGTVVERSIQHRIQPNLNTYIGPGKVEWLKQTIKTLEVDVVVINDIVKSGQLFRLERAMWEVNTRIKVWDRVDLILNIFQQHATTIEAKLQIQLARLQHTGPRIYGLGKTELSSQGGGIGTRGLGETNIERERRLIKRETQKIEQQLKRRTNQQWERMQQRKRQGISTVALVGYTSAGKTTLFNALTKKEKVVDKSLFTTLDSIVGTLKQGVPSQKLLISDTIGFIDKLPPLLINAFKSTLMEATSSQVLLHVIDASDMAVERKLQVVESILAELGVERTPILIFNKIDAAQFGILKTLKRTFAARQHLFVSAKTGEGIADLKLLLSEVVVTRRKQFSSTDSLNHHVSS